MTQRFDTLILCFHQGPSFIPSRTEMTSLWTVDEVNEVMKWEIRISFFWTKSKLSSKSFSKKMKKMCYVRFGILTKPMLCSSRWHIFLIYQLDTVDHDILLSKLNGIRGAENNWLFLSPGTNYLKHSFGYSVAVAWNSLPVDLMAD